MCTPLSKSLATGLNYFANYAHTVVYHTHMNNYVPGPDQPQPLDSMLVHIGFESKINVACMQFDLLLIVPLNIIAIAQGHHYYDH